LPHGEAIARRGADAEQGQDLFAVSAELVRLAEEVGLVDGDEIRGLVELGAAALFEAEELVVLAERVQPERGDAVAEATLEDRSRLGAEEDAAVLVEELAQQPELGHFEVDVPGGGHELPLSPGHRGDARRRAVLRSLRAD